jgi:serine/threonine protein kinase/ABC-type branched-subunit amino acid transport system substrate-binding protein
MSLCINPDCPQPDRPNSESSCGACGTSLSLGEGYRLVGRLQERHNPITNLLISRVYEAQGGDGTKIIKILYTTDQPYINLFEREIRILQSLNRASLNIRVPRVELHPEIASGTLQLTSRTYPEIRYLVMEKIEGQNLRDCLNNPHTNSLSEEKAMNWLKQLVKILKEIHEFEGGFIHRDIKPENIILTQSNDLVLIDFGCVREILETSLIIRNMNTMILSVGYTPQEQIEGNATPQSDFFALGRTFVHLLTMPPPGELDDNIHNWHSLAPSISPVFVNLVNWLMKPKVEDRPQNALAILQGLTAIERGKDMQTWCKITKEKLNDKKAIAWLKKLLISIDILHNNDKIHQDIHPSNIVLTTPSEVVIEDEALMLLNFGTVISTTDTDTAHPVVSRQGYTPEEQIKGNPKRQSDFFALGRTFVYLLTKEEPENLLQEGRLQWRERAQEHSTISPKVMNLIDELMKPRVEDRPQKVADILKKLDARENPPHLLPYFLLSLVSIALIGGLIKYGLFPYLEKKAIFALCKTSENFLSCGEKLNFQFSPQGQPTGHEKLGRDALQRQDYDKAIEHLEMAWKQDKDPTLLIALNNARILRDLEKGVLKSQEIYPVAAAVPYSNTPEFVSEKMLQGIAWKQDKFNESNQYPWKLFILMGDDKNNKDTAPEIAKIVINKESIVGVIGPYSSRVAAHVINFHCDLNISLVSPLASSTLEDLKKIYKDRFQSELNHSCFFRPLMTTEKFAETMVRYLEREGYKNVLILYDRGEAFSSSSYKSLQAKINKKRVISHQEKFFLDNNLSEIEKEIKKWKQKYQKERDSTAIVFLSAAYNDPDTKKKITILKTNNGFFRLIGSNPVYDPQLLQTLQGLGMKADVIENMVVTPHWFPNDSVQDKKNEQDYHDFWETEYDLTAFVAMPYDATQMTIDGINRALSPHKKVSREDLKKALSDPNFKTSATPNSTITGEIRLDGSDRQPTSDYQIPIIQPFCSNNPCRWRRIN